MAITESRIKALENSFESLQLLLEQVLNKLNDVASKKTVNTLLALNEQEIESLKNRTTNLESSLTNIINANAISP